MKERKYTSPARRHAAIMFTDIVGYTALMGKDEDRAFDTLRKNREIHTKLIEQFRGTLIKEMGDGMLISFDLASDAVRCAIEIQKASKSHDIPLKIGIHEGEMVFEGHDVLGDGVNIASRIQDDTEEGCIMISGSVYRDIKNKADIQTKFVEGKRFKNVDEPIKVYQVLCEEEAQERQPRIKNRIVFLRNNNPYYLLAGLVVITVAILFVWKSSPTKKVSELEKSIAVIPFWNDSSDPENDYFCPGMEEEIRIQLFKISELRIEARQSVEKYRENPEKDVITIGEELDVAYIVEGSVRKIADDVRVTIQLINAKTGNHIWGETYDGDYTDKILEFQSHTAKQIAASLNTFITPEEENRIDHKQTDEITAYDFFIRGEYERSLYYKTGDKKHLKNSHNLLDRAIEIDPNYVEAYSSKASTYVAEANLDSMIYYVDQALKIDPNNPFANNRKARYYQGSGKPDLAIQYYLKSLKYNPNDVLSNLYLSQVYCVQNKDIQTGYPYLKKAMELTVRNKDRIHDIGQTLLDLGEYGKAEKYLWRYLSETGSCRGLDAYNWFLLAEGNYYKVLHFTDSICPLMDCNDMCNEWFIRLYSYLSEFEKAELYIKKWKDEVGESIYRPEIGYVFHKLGRVEEAEEFFNMCINNDDEYKSDKIKYSTGTNYRLARIYAFQNKKHEALQYIEVINKLGIHIDLFDLMIHDPMFENLWDDPEFKAIIKKAQDEKAAIRVQIREMEAQGELDL